MLHTGLDKAIFAGGRGHLLCLSVIDSALPVRRHLPTGEGFGSLVRICKGYYIVIRKREVGEKIKSYANIPILLETRRCLF